MCLPNRGHQYTMTTHNDRHRRDGDTEDYVLRRLGQAPLKFIGDDHPRAERKRSCVAIGGATSETQRGGRRGSIYDVPYNPAQANATRDALSKAIYNNLFEWIVSRINMSMKPRAAAAQLIGILVRSNCFCYSPFLTVGRRISSVSRSSRTTPSNNCASTTSTRSFSRYLSS